MKVGVIVSARVGSTRAPCKALLSFQNKPAIQFLLERMISSSSVDKIVLATSDIPENDILLEIAHASGVSYFAGSNDNLVDRYIFASEAHNIDLIIRVTGDCPFVNSSLIDFAVNKYKDCLLNNSFSIASTKNFFPIGLDLECFMLNTLKRLNTDFKLSHIEKEHLTLGMYNRPEYFKKIEIRPKVHNDFSLSNQSFTLDTFADYERFSTKTFEVNLVDNLISNLIDC